MFIGIDFGTTNTNISWINPKDNSVECLTLDDNGKLGIPSYIVQSKVSGDFFYGKAAKEMFESENFDDQNYEGFPSLKTDFRQWNATKVEKKFGKPLDDMIVDYFVYILTDLKKNQKLIFSSDDNNANIVLGRPVLTKDKERRFYTQRLEEAVEKAFKKVYNNVNVLIKPVEEPILGIYAFYDKVDQLKNKTIAVFDMGGGTTDVAIVKCDENGVFSICKDKEGEATVIGDSTLGGNIIDLKLHEHIVKELKLNLADNEIKRIFNTNPNLRKKAEQLKEKLNDKSYKWNPIDLQEYCSISKGKLTYKQNVTISLLSVITDKLKEGILNLFKGVCQKYFDADNNNKINQVIMIGGSCKLTLIKDEIIERVLSSYTDKFMDDNNERLTEVKPNPGLLGCAVAKGAAVYARDVAFKNYSQAKNSGEEKLLFNEKDIPKFVVNEQKTATTKTLSEENNKLSKYRYMFYGVALFALINAILMTRGFVLGVQNALPLNNFYTMLGLGVTAIAMLAVSVWLFMGVCNQFVIPKSNGKDDDKNANTIAVKRKAMIALIVLSTILLFATFVVGLMNV